MRRLTRKEQEKKLLELNEQAVKSNLLALRFQILTLKPAVVKKLYSKEELVEIFGSENNYLNYLQFIGDKENLDRESLGNECE